MSQSTGTYVGALVMFSFTFCIVSVIGFTDVIHIAAKKLMRKICAEEVDEELNSETVCDDKERCDAAQVESQYTVQTVINHDFISTWL